MIRAALLALALLASETVVVAQPPQVLSNPGFTSWPHGPSVRGSFGPGNETAGGWISKWGHEPASSAVVSRTAFGARYAMRPAAISWPGHGDNGETFYLRQTVGPLRSHLGHTYHAVVDARANGVVKYGFYINARWNHTNRIYIVNTVNGPRMSNARAQYEVTFRMPTGAGIDWPLAPSQGIEFAFLMTVQHPATVDFHAIRLYQTK